jgi:hypothetical protein
MSLVIFLHPLVGITGAGSGGEDASGRFLISEDGFESLRMAVGMTTA